jgi:hypothetical protein
MANFENRIGNSGDSEGRREAGLDVFVHFLHLGKDSSIYFCLYFLFIV